MIAKTPLGDFHLDCLCSDARLNVDFDLTLTVLADLLYRRLAERLKGLVRTSPARLLRKFIATPGMIEIRANEVIVHLSKRAHNPLLNEAGLTKPTAAHPSGGPVAGGAIGTSGMPLTA